MTQQAQTTKADKTKLTLVESYLMIYGQNTDQVYADKKT